jgi:hypothetical protein
MIGDIAPLGEQQNMSVGSNLAVKTVEKFPHHSMLIGGIEKWHDRVKAAKHWGSIPKPDSAVNRVVGRSAGGVRVREYEVH